MPTSIKVKLRRNANKAGLYGIVIQVIHNRKPTEISINEYVSKKHFDFGKGIVKSSHPRSAMLNKIISDERKKIEDIVFDLKQSGKPFALKDVTFHFKEDLSPRDIDNPYLRDYMDTFIKANPEDLSFSTLKYYQTSLN